MNTLSTGRDTNIGVILCSARMPDEALFPLVERYAAAVLINRHAPAELASNLEIDDTYGTMRAVHHLLASNRRPVGFLAGPSHSFSGKRRLEGYTNALETTGQSVEASMIEPCSPDEHGGLKAAKALLKRHPEVRGLVCYNDLVAIGTLRACAELGLKVPNDLAVIGCDDIRMASLVSPALSTLRVDKYDLGAQAVHVLLGRMEKSMAKSDVVNGMVVKPELVVRARGWFKDWLTLFMSSPTGLSLRRTRVST